ncbi:CLUMA_CG019044, isoform A [Clunio marinus]|uniref:CLUMA_CG019044, isoform A n=1 Tax=Clunio marinus TaxID=568069 RepID=A0A1J1J2P0_9DIPT|nr:CLUMA_CG019044, isoform A [Clunio marinus]
MDGKIFQHKTKIGKREMIRKLKRSKMSSESVLIDNAEDIVDQLFNEEHAKPVFRSDVSTILFIALIICFIVMIIYWYCVDKEKGAIDSAYSKNSMKRKRIPTEDPEEGNNDRELLEIARPKIVLSTPSRNEVEIESVEHDDRKKRERVVENLSSHP